MQTDIVDVRKTPEPRPTVKPRRYCVQHLLAVNRSESRSFV